MNLQIPLVEWKAASTLDIALRLCFTFGQYWMQSTNVIKEGILFNLLDQLYYGMLEGRLLVLIFNILSGVVKGTVKVLWVWY